MTAELLELCWPSDRLGECLHALTRQARLVAPAAFEPPPFIKEVGTYLCRTAEALNCEADTPLLFLRDLEETLPVAVPAIIQIAPTHFVAVIGRRKQDLLVLTSDLRKCRLPLAAICRSIREPHASKHRTAVAAMLSGAQLGPTHAPAVEAVVLERIAPIRFEGCWTIRPSSGAGLRVWLRQAAVTRNAAGLLFVHLLQYLIWLLAWTVLGRMSFSGRMDRGTLIGWALLLATAVPFQLLGTWLQGLVVVGSGGMLKKRLLSGALKLRPDEIRHEGIGAFLVQALEAEAVEQLALGGGVAGLLAILDLVIAGCILGSRAILLVAWFGFAVFCGYRFMRAFARWSSQRFQQTSNLVESMLGHRTRLTQQPRESWHREEDRKLDGYHHYSTALDRVGVILISVVPRGWLILGLASTISLLASGSQSISSLAVVIGGVLLSYNAFGQLAGSFSEVAAAVVAWNTVVPLFKAAARPSGTGALMETPSASTNSRILEADRVTFRYRQNGAPILDNCTVSVRPHDRILLEGPSGGGKTTLASILSGVREPQSGLLLSGGLDRTTLGDSGWADRVISVPQFHENHILTGTVAFNLLLGRSWPPRAGDVQAADEVCRRLGLGDLLDKMPNGLQQMIGEGGWQLSHGEKTRIFMARALLQDSELLILDESFGALDPENMQLCLEYTLERANALMVIAHP